MRIWLASPKKVRIMRQMMKASMIPRVTLIVRKGLNSEGSKIDSKSRSKETKRSLRRKTGSATFSKESMKPWLTKHS